MKHSAKSIVLAAFLAVSAWTYFFTPTHRTGIFELRHDQASEEEEEEREERKQEGNKEMKFAFNKARLKYEFDMIKDPGTGRIPKGIFVAERELARSIPVRGGKTGSGAQDMQDQNIYQAAGPDSIGGRTRALAIDKRFNNGSNRVILSGSVSGGIMRSADGGNNWIRVSPENDVHSLSAIAQDTRPGNENTWYAGGGEPIGNSATDDGAVYLGHGIWKSTDNGINWNKLPLTVTDLDGGSVLNGGTLEIFDNPFDFVHRIVVNPINGHVYVAGHRRLVRSTDGGNTWKVVFSTVKPLGSASGQMDIAITNTGKIYLAVNGAVRDLQLRGIWTSNTGDPNSWTRIAGGQTPGVDSIAGWRANSYTVEDIDNNPFPPDTTFSSKRIVLQLAPSNNNILYVLYENGLSGGGTDPKPEADLFKLDASSGQNKWTNLSANMPDFPGEMEGVDPIALQGGYNLMIAVKPDDPNFVVVGGTNLYRSTTGFSTKTETSWIGGYNQDFASGLKIYPSSHPDFHSFAFFPNNNNSNPGFKKAITGDDGGLQITDDITKAGDVEPVSWKMVNRYQTLQYYHIALDNTPGQFSFIGGAQDNGTQLRVDGDGNNHIRIISGDGGAAAIGKITNTAFTLYGSTQLGAIYRYRENDNFKSIRPNNLTPFPGMSDSYGEFVTYYKMDFDNPEIIYYANFNRLFRSTAATTVSSSGWEELTGVRSKINPGNPSGGTGIGIRSLEPSRGPYTTSHVLYIGTSNGKIFRLDDPKNALTSASPVDITPADLDQFRRAGTPVNIADIAVNPNNDNEIMAVVSNYSVTTAGGQVKNDFNIWWTNNAKSATPTWRKVEGNLTLPSVRSCMIVVKKEGNTPVTEYYVGTSIGLYSTKNISGTTNVNWIREGGNTLNYAVVSTMDYRPQDNVLLIGTHGNGAYIAEIGSPDFRPDQPTATNDPVRNDKNFIRAAYPSIVTNSLNYTVGNMFTVKKLVITVTNLTGQRLARKETGYTNGQIDLGLLPPGAYILTISSTDYKQQFVRKFLKE